MYLDAEAAKAYGIVDNVPLPLPLPVPVPVPVPLPLPLPLPVPLPVPVPLPLTRCGHVCNAQSVGGCVLLAPSPLVRVYG